MNIDQHTGLYGIIGRPLGHTLSPLMHNAAFAACGLNAVYLAFETPDPAAALQAVRALNIRGLSVTLPHKSAVIPLLDELEPLAAKIGAVNTIVNRNGRLFGWNTDAAGGLKALEQSQAAVSGKACLIIGAGGAARALAWSLKQKGARVAVTNRSEDKGSVLAAELDGEFIPWERRNDFPAGIAIQTTPIGMAPQADQSPVADEFFRPGMIAMDIVYNPLETRFLKAAQARGCRTINGLEMFIRQGVEQFRLWTGLEAPLEVMRQAVSAVLRRTVL